MYRAALGAKIVSIVRPTQAAAGVDELLADLEVGDLGICAKIPTGSACRGFEAGGVLGRCVCVNLQDPDTTAEVKQLVSTASGKPLSKSMVWTLADEDALAGWAETYAGFYGPDLRHPWKSGAVSVADLLQRTEAGDVYPTGQGLLALFDESGCIPDERGVCPPYARLNDAILALRSGAGALDEVDSVKLYPPYFGETSSSSSIRPGQLPPSGAELHVDLGLERSSAWLGWTAAGLAVAAAWWLKERRV